MGFGHEKLDVYRATIEYVGWVYRFCRALSAAENASRKALLDRIVAMLTKLGQRGYAVNEDQAQYSVGVDPDTDIDPDCDYGRGDPHRSSSRVKQETGA